MPRKSEAEKERALLCSRCHLKRWVTDIPKRLCLTCKEPPKTAQVPTTPAARPFNEIDWDEEKL